MFTAKNPNSATNTRFIDDSALWLSTKGRETLGYAAFALSTTDSMPDSEVLSRMQQVLAHIPEGMHVCFALHSRPLPDAALRDWAAAREGTKSEGMGQALACERSAWVLKKGLARHPARERRAFIFMRVSLGSKALRELDAAVARMVEHAESLELLFRSYQFPLKVLSQSQLKELRGEVKNKFVAQESRGRTRWPSTAENAPVAIHLNLRQAPQMPLADVLMHTEHKLTGEYWAWSSASRLCYQETVRLLQRARIHERSLFSQFFWPSVPVHGAGEAAEGAAFYHTANGIVVKGADAWSTNKDLQNIVKNLRDGGFSPVVDYNLPTSWLPCSDAVAMRARRGGMAAPVAESALLMPSLAYTPSTPLSTGGTLLQARDGTLRTFDPFSAPLDNGNNFIVAGQAGAGTSFFCKEVLAAHLSAGHRACVISTQGDFAKLAVALEGKSLKVTNDSGLCFNPFGLIQSEKDLNSNLGLLAAWVMLIAASNTAYAFEEPTLQQRAAVEEAIVRCWQRFQNKMDLSLIQWHLNHGTESEKCLAQRLEAYVSGPYASLFRGEPLVPLDNPFTVFDIDALRQTEIGEVMGQTLLLFTYLHWNEPSMVPEKKLILVDTADALGRSNPVELVKNLLRRYRALNVGFGTTARTCDLTGHHSSGSVVAAAILPNVSQIVMMGNNQGAAHFEKEQHFPQLLQTALQPRILNQLRTSRESGAVLSIANTAGGVGVFRFQVDPLSFSLLSSDPSRS